MIAHHGAAACPAIGYCDPCAERPALTFSVDRARDELTVEWDGLTVIVELDRDDGCLYVPHQILSRDGVEPTLCEALMERFGWEAI